MALLLKCSRLAAWCSSTHSVETNDANQHAHLFEFFEPVERLGVGGAVNGEDGIELADFMLQDFGEIAVVAARTSCRRSVLLSDRDFLGLLYLRNVIKHDSV